MLLFALQIFNDLHKGRAGKIKGAFFSAHLCLNQPTPVPVEGRKLDSVVVRLHAFGTGVISSIPTR